MNFTDFHTYLLSEKRCSLHTLSAYKHDLSQFSDYCQHYFEVRSADQVTDVMIRSWMAHLMEQGYQATSVHRKLAAVNAYYQFLLRNSTIQTNPAKGLSKPKKPKRLPVFINEKNMLKIYSETAQENPSFVDERDRLIVQLFYETGMRLSELMQLSDNDIDFSIGQIKVLGKRNKIRYIPVSEHLMTRIKQYQHLRDAQHFENKECKLWLTRLGKKVGRSFIYKLVTTNLASLTTMKKKSPHVLRHTFATHLLNNGADLNVIKELLGHSSLAATQVYTHNSIEKLKNIHRRLHPRDHAI